MIDDCPHTFSKLAKEILPSRMAELRTAMEKPMPLARFAEYGVGPKTILREMKRTEDFSACYVLMDNGPFYVGISRKVVQRLHDHVCGTDHWTASLAHMMAVDDSGYAGTRRVAMEDPTYVQAFERAKQKLSEGSVAFVEIDNPVELYLLEVYAAMELDTSKWNSFATH
ncbi:hypothetical protein LCGC14_2275410 [marine sediment metagenome]|uniref:GIY-YIG domain-containing protein n=1 Tax=marine sediment metagenome TaxID=412755 RepID=A0A0F9FQV9_9ZZZZ